MWINSVTNSAVCSSDRHNSSAVALFGSIFIGEIEQTGNTDNVVSKKCNTIFTSLFIELMNTINIIFSIG